jgi:hypothetical protein
MPETLSAPPPRDTTPLAKARHRAEPSIAPLLSRSEMARVRSGGLARAKLPRSRAMGSDAREVTTHQNPLT